MIRRDFLKACGLFAVGAALLRALARPVQPENAALRLSQLSAAYKRLLFGGDPQESRVIFSEIVSLARQMEAAGVPAAHILGIVWQAKCDVAALRA